MQFIHRVVLTMTPFTSLGEVESLDMPHVVPERAYLIEDDGDRHIRITKAVGGFSARIPWSNIASAVDAPVKLTKDPPPLAPAIRLPEPGPLLAEVLAIGPAPGYGDKGPVTHPKKAPKPTKGKW